MSTLHAGRGIAQRSALISFLCQLAFFLSPFADEICAQSTLSLSTTPVAVSGLDSVTLQIPADLDTFQYTDITFFLEGGEGGKAERDDNNSPDDGFITYTFTEDPTPGPAPNAVCKDAITLVLNDGEGATFTGEDLDDGVYLLVVEGTSGRRTERVLISDLRF